MSFLSTGLRNKLLGSASGGVAGIFAAGFIRVYSGAVPLTADAAIGSSGANVLLGTYSIDHTGTGINFDASTTDNVLQKDSGENWQMVAAASGTASFFRLLPAVNTTTASTAEARIQGVISTGGPVMVGGSPYLPDIILGDVALVSATIYTLENFNVSMQVGRKSTGLCCALLGGGGGDTTFMDLFALSKISVYSGDVPATADDSIGAATLLVSYFSNWPTNTVGLSFDAPPANQAYILKAAAETWKGTAVATDDATFFRLTIAGGTTGSSSTEVRYQGRVSVDGFAEMIRSPLTFTSGDDYVLPGVVFTIPSGVAA